MVAILALNLHTTVPLALVLDLHRHIIPTHVLVVAGARDSTGLARTRILYQDLVLLQQV